VATRRVELKGRRPKGNGFKRDNRTARHYVGRQIRAPRVLCIDDQNVNRGVIPITEALQIAESSGLDLVQISKASRDEVPTCKVLDYSKFKFEQSKKEKAAKKKQRESTVKVKELRFRPSTDDNDLIVKAKKAAEFLKDGDRVKATVMFKGRELAYKEAGAEVLYRFVKMIGVATQASAPQMMGRHLSLLISLAPSNSKSVEVA
jgi:translation initiation factor IF-3